MARLDAHHIAQGHDSTGSEKGGIEFKEAESGVARHWHLIHALETIGATHLSHQSRLQADALFQVFLFDFVQILPNWASLELNSFVTVQIKCQQFTDPLLPDTYKWVENMFFLLK